MAARVREARLLGGCWLVLIAPCWGQQTTAEQWIEAGHWKRARAEVEARMREAPNDARANFLLSQIRAAFGDRATPLRLAEKAVALDGRTAKYHRQVAEVLGVVAQHSNAFQQVLLARRFRKEIDTALALDPRDVQANRDLLEFYLLAPAITGGSRREAGMVAGRIAGIDATEGLLAKARLAGFDKQPALQETLLRQAATAVRYRAKMALAEFDLAAEHRNLQGAETAAREAIGIDGGRADAYGVLAAVCADRGSWNELDGVVAEAERAAPDDLYPELRAAERLMAEGRELDRAERYLRAYVAQEPEGNRPAAAEASRTLEHIFELRRRFERSGSRTQRDIP